jgi:hypothetical protein
MNPNPGLWAPELQNYTSDSKPSKPHSPGDLWLRDEKLSSKVTSNCYLIQFWAVWSDGFHYSELKMFIAPNTLLEVGGRARHTLSLLGSIDLRRIVGRVAVWV